MNVIFNKIYIFDILTKQAFVTCFEKGLILLLLVALMEQIEENQCCCVAYTIL